MPWDTSAGNASAWATLPLATAWPPTGVHVEPDDAEQAALRRIRELRDNHTLRAIAQNLNERGFRTRRGSAWRHEYVKRVLAPAS